MKSVKQIHPLPDRTTMRKMGVVKNLKDIRRRSLSAGAQWEEHLEKTRQFILNCGENKQTGTAAILGSGWLLEIPLDGLARKFEKVQLFDLYHPPQVHKMADKRPNVELIQTDLTGGAVEEAYQAAKTYRKKGEKTLINSLSTGAFQFIQSPDFVVSANVLHQLNKLITNYLKKKGVYNDKELLQLAKQLQEDHLELLPENKSCLISDMEEELYDEQGAFVGSRPLLNIHFPHSNYKKQWQWRYDPHMKDREGIQTFRNVTGLTL